MNKRLLLLAVITAIVFPFGQVLAATINSNAVTGNWLSTSSWVGGVVPGVNDIAVIVNGANITVNGNISVGSVQVNTGGTLNGSSAVITLYDDWTVNGTFNRGTSTVIFNGNSAQVINGTGTVSFHHITVNNTNGGPGMGVSAHPVNTIIYGNFDQNGVFNRNSTSFPNAKVTFAGNTIVSGVTSLILHNVDILPGATLFGATGLNGGSSDMYFTGNWNNTGTFVPGTGTVSVQYSSSYTTQTIATNGSPFYNLRVNKNVNVNPQNSITVQNDFTIVLGTWNASGFTLNVGGNFTNMATFNAGTGLLNMNGTANQNISTGASTLYNFTVNKAGGSVYFASNVEVTNNVNLTSGVVHTYVTPSTLYELYISNTNASTSLTNASAASFVVGNLKRAVIAGAANYSFPLGVMNSSPLKYRPITYSQTNSNGAAYVNMIQDLAPATSVNTADWYTTITTNTGNPSGNITVSYNLGSDFPNSIQECIIAVIRGQSTLPATWNHVLATVTSPSGGNNGSITAALPAVLTPNSFILGEPLPVAPGTTVCEGSTATLTAGFPTGSAHFNWYDSSSGGNLLASDSAIYVTPILSANTTYYLEYFDSLTGCTGPRVPVIVNVTPAPSSAFTMPDTICMGSNALITFQGTNSPTGTYYWNFDGGIVVSGSGPSNHTVYWNTPGPKNVTLSITDNPCSSFLTLQTIEVVPTPTAATLTTSNFAVCSGDSVVLTAGGSVGGTITYSFWDSLPGVSFVGYSPLMITPTDTSTFYLTVINEFGCEGPNDSITIFAYPLPAVYTPYSTDVEICYGDSASLYVVLNQPPQADVYWWDSQAGGNFIASGTTISTGALFQNTTYWVEAVTPYGCTNGGRIPVTVAIKPLPVATLSSDAVNNTIYTGQAMTITADPPGYQSYEFYVNNTLVQAGPNNTYTSFTFIDDDLVTIIVVNDSCRGVVSDSLLVNVLPIANAFTPNGDGINDVFLKGLDLTITNRWGQELYRGKDGWDGTFEGKKVSPGTYYYIYKMVDINGKETSFTGPVTVVDK